METQKITGKITNTGEVRANSTGIGYNLMIQIEGLGNGVFFFGTEEELKEIKNKLSHELYTLEYVEDVRGIRGCKIEKTSPETAEPQQEIPCKQEPIVKTIYRRWNNTIEYITQTQMDEYLNDYLTYAKELRVKIAKALPGETHFENETVFEKALTPLQYFIEDQIRIKDMKM